MEPQGRGKKGPPKGLPRVLGLEGGRERAGQKRLFPPLFPPKCGDFRVKGEKVFLFFFLHSREAKAAFLFSLVSLLPLSESSDQISRDAACRVETGH